MDDGMSRSQRDRAGSVERKRLTGLLLTATVLALTGCSSEEDGGSAQSAAPVTPNLESASEELAVREAFEGYRQALIDKDGNQAASRVTSSTIDAYQDFRDQALMAEEGTVRSLSMANRMQVLLLRHRIDPAELEQMDGRAVFAYAVDREWVGKDGVVRIELHDIAVNGARATARVGVNGVTSAEVMHFRKEDGEWRFDLGPTLRRSDQVLQQLASQRGLTENEYLFSMITTLSGEQVTDAIWQPPH